MKQCSLLTVATLAILLGSCQNNDSLDSIVSQKFVHKYGFDLSPKEWEESPEDGQEVALLKNGVKITRSYENGILHGPTTYTFPHKATVEKCLVYDQGTLLKETIYDQQGMPIREEAYEYDDRMIVTLWDQQGVPLSIEEYDGDILVDGKYFTTEHELDGKVENGFGERVKRDRSGLLISRDQIENGILVQRTTYHPSGHVHTVSHYHDYQLHGEQLKFTSIGRPLMRLCWNHGVLDGSKTIYRNGLKAAEIPYVAGEKHGTELRYDDLGNLTAEVLWRNDRKHGCCKFYTEDSSESHWFFNGNSVTASKFELLEEREQMIAEFNQMEDSSTIR